MKKIINIIAIVLLTLPTFAGAQTLKDINSVASKATNLGNLIVELLIGFAVIWIIVSIVRYLIAGEDMEARKNGGYAVLYGVIGLFLILSIWGLVWILKNSFTFSDNNRPSLENIKIKDPTTGSSGGNSSLPCTDANGVGYDC